MAFDFPSSPSEGQSYHPTSYIEYVFTGYAWRRLADVVDPTLVLDLDFSAGTLDSKVTFTRTTTGTYVNSTGLGATAAIDAARFDHDPVTFAARGLLLEEQRTNYALQSEAFATSPWTNAHTSTTANTTTAPDGTTTADTITTAAGPSSFIYQFLTTVAATYTASVYVKKADASTVWVMLGIEPSNGAGHIWFNINTGTLGSVTPGGGVASATVTALPNGWYRLTYTRTTVAAGSSNVRLGPVDADGVGGGSGAIAVYAWGFQLEIGAFATSYIPTTTEAVTRADDAVGMMGANFSSWYNASEGTFVLEMERATTGGAPFILCANHNLGSSDQVTLYEDTPGSWAAYMTTGGAMQVHSPIGTYTANTLFKVGYAVKANDVAACLNGGAVVTDATATMSALINDLRIGTDYGGVGSHVKCAHYKRLRYYNVRKTNVELQALTT